MKCPFCGGEDCHIIQETQTEGKDFLAGKGLCGYCCMGPIGLIFGFCGKGKQFSTRTFWICNGCGRKFSPTGEETNTDDNLGWIAVMVGILVALIAIIVGFSLVGSDNKVDEKKTTTEYEEPGEQRDPVKNEEKGDAKAEETENLKDQREQAEAERKISDVNEVEEEEKIWKVISGTDDWGDEVQGKDVVETIVPDDDDHYAMIFFGKLSNGMMACGIHFVYNTTGWDCTLWGDGVLKVKCDGQTGEYYLCEHDNTYFLFDALTVIDAGLSGSDLDGLLDSALSIIAGSDLETVRDYFDVDSFISLLYNGNSEVKCVVKDQYSSNVFRFSLKPSNFAEVYDSIWGSFDGSSQSGANTSNRGTGKFDVIKADLSWEEAREDAIRRGGHLATLNSPDEYYAMITMLGSGDYQGSHLWIGGKRDGTNMDYLWLKDNGTLGGKSVLHEPGVEGFWMENEPSYYDEGLSVQEDSLCMIWYSSKWVCNDIPGDILSILPSYSGTLGYIIEYES